MNIFKKLYITVVSKYNAGIDKRLLKKLLVDVPEADKPYFDALMRNELNYLNNLFVHQDTQQKERKQKEFFLQMTKRVIEKLLVLKNIVGIQPMQGPVGLVYLLQYAISGEGNSCRIEVQKEAVTAGTRKLCASWAIEAAQDLQSLHGIDIMAELQSALGHEVADELVAEIISNLQNLGNKSPDNRQQKVATRDGVIFAINTSASSIAMKTRRGAGNFIITSPMGVSLLQSDKHITFVTPDLDAQMELTSLVHAGNIMANDSIMYPVYMSLAVKEESPSQITFIVGYKGRSGEIDTGYVYSPYVPVMPGGHVIDPQTFQPMMTLMTRYGKTMAKATEESPVEASAYYRTVVYDSALETIE